MRDARDIILRPIVTEKTADAKEQSNTVCFQVATDAKDTTSTGLSSVLRKSWELSSLEIQNV